LSSNEYNLYMSAIANKIFSNTLWQTSIRLINILIGIFSLAIITRILGASGFGYYTTSVAFVHMVMILADLGLYLVLLREISSIKTRRDERKIINNIFTIRFFSSVIVLLLAPIMVKFFPYSSEVKTAILFLVANYFFHSLISTLTAVFAKHLDMPKVALVDLFNKILYSSILIFLFFNGSNLNIILGASSLVSALSFILFYLFLRRYVHLKFAWDFIYWKKVFYIAWPLAVTVFLNLIYFKADTLILAAFKDPDIVGLYGAPYRILEVIATFPHMFMGLILPLFTAAWVTNNREKLNNVLQHSFDFFVIICAGLIAGTWLVSTPLMILLAGKEFAASGPILNLLILATVSIFFGTLFTYMVVALKKQKEMIKYFLLTAAIGLIAYFIFIPIFSYWAAASVTLLVEILIGFFAYSVVRQHVSLSLNYTILNKSLMAAFLSFTITWFIKDINIFLTMISCVFIYVAVLYFTKAIDKSTLKELLNKQK